eukprot:2380513-Rhodomonas_salina.4
MSAGCWCPLDADVRIHGTAVRHLALGTNSFGVEGVRELAAVLGQVLCRVSSACPVLYGTSHPGKLTVFCCGVYATTFPDS